MLGNLIGGFVTILVGVTLAPVVANSISAINTTAGGSNLSGANYTIFSLVTLFFILGIMSAGVAIAAQGLRAAPADILGCGQV